MKRLVVFGILLLCILVLPAGATTVSCPVPTVTVNNNIAISNILTQIQWMTQQQSQAQQQEQSQHITQASGTTNSWIGASSGSGNGQENIGGIVQNSQTYSRLLYPGEVLAFPAPEGSVCTVLAGLPISFYSIGAGHGYFKDMVQSSEATPTYDPIYHRMDYGHVPVIDDVGYYTMKAKFTTSEGAAFCVVDNRAPMNGYTTIEVTVQS